MRSSAGLRAWLGAARVLLAGGALFAVAVLTYGVVGSAAAMVAASAVRGAGFALRYVALVIAVGALLSRERQAGGQALLQTTLMGAAPIVGSSAGGVAYEHAGPGPFFAVAGVLALLGALVSRAGLLTTTR
jgi:MFS transporter, PPP family, 3-phenylpropionic acid transporter